MDWMNRGTRPNQAINEPINHSGNSSGSSSHKKANRPQGWLKIASVVLLLSGALLVIALLCFTIFGTKPNTEAKYVDTNKYQAVFLNGGQVYFGHIRTLNNKYVRLGNIWYLRVNQTVQPNGQQQSSSPELVQLGCELHRPQDEMLINREQVIFWENLKDDANENTVPGAIKKYLASNPGTQTCNTASQSSSTTPTTTTPTTKKQ